MADSPVIDSRQTEVCLLQLMDSAGCLAVGAGRILFIKRTEQC